MNLFFNPSVLNFCGEKGEKQLQWHMEKRGSSMKSITQYLFALACVFTLASSQQSYAEPHYAVSTEHAPKAFGPYSQAVRAGQFLFISGQIGMDPLTSNFVPGSIVEQTKQVLDNIEAILQQEGLTFENVVKSEVYLQDMNDFQAINRCYEERFVYSVKPARQTMAVKGLPRGALIEISCIAYVPKK